MRVFALLFAFAFSAVNAQTFPSKIVRLVSGVTPGSASDTMARVVAEKMTALLASGRRAQASHMFETSLRLVSFGAAVLAFVCVLLSGEITEVIFSSRYAASAPAGA